MIETLADVDDFSIGKIVETMNDTYNFWDITNVL